MVFPFRLLICVVYHTIVALQHNSYFRPPKPQYKSPGGCLRQIREGFLKGSTTVLPVADPVVAVSLRQLGTAQDEQVFGVAGVGRIGEVETARDHDALVDDHFTPVMAAEDFAHMLEVRPGCYAFIGNGDGGHRLPDHGPGPCVIHNTSYDFNDAIIPIGATYFVRLVQRWLARP